jgi:hypothetical protein
MKTSALAILSMALLSILLTPTTAQKDTAPDGES